MFCILKSSSKYCIKVLPFSCYLIFASDLVRLCRNWSKTENVSFLIKQLERTARFVNNTLVAKKFDKNILDKSENPE